MTDSSEKLIQEAENISNSLENLNKVRNEFERLDLDNPPQHSEFLILENETRSSILNEIKKVDLELEQAINLNDFNKISSLLEVVKDFDEYFKKHFQPKDNKESNFF